MRRPVAVPAPARHAVSPHGVGALPNCLDFLGAAADAGTLSSGPSRENVVALAEALGYVADRARQRYTLLRRDGRVRELVVYAEGGQLITSWLDSAAFAATLPGARIRAGSTNGTALSYSDIDVEGTLRRLAQWSDGQRTAPEGAI